MYHAGVVFPVGESVADRVCAAVDWDCHLHFHQNETIRQTAMQKVIRIRTIFLGGAVLSFMLLIPIELLGTVANFGEFTLAWVALLYLISLTLGMLETMFDSQRKMKQVAHFAVTTVIYGGYILLGGGILVSLVLATIFVGFDAIFIRIIRRLAVRLARKKKLEAWEEYVHTDRLRFQNAAENWEAAEPGIYYYDQS